MGFLRIFQKVSISGQIVSEMLAGYIQKTPHRLFKVFLGVPQKKVCLEFSKHYWPTISDTICLEMLVLG